MRSSPRTHRSFVRAHLPLLALIGSVVALTLFCATAGAQAATPANRFAEASAAAAARTDSALAGEIVRLRAGDVSPSVVRRLGAINDSLADREQELREAIAGERAAALCLRALPRTAPAYQVSNCFAQRARRASSAELRVADGRQPRVPSTGAKVATLLLATGGGYVAGRQEHDPGGYVDSWRPLPDKQAHFAFSVTTGTISSAAAGNTWGFASCLAAGAALELGQRYGGGYASGYDLAYDAVGCGGGLLAKAIVAELLGH